ncbi:MAG TPA: cytochrome c3 family protein [Dissulfurispiraceae bacterium]|nr:cytochrome c3 family protein [Dissulfurispiraceae bacterium]
MKARAIRNLFISLAYAGFLVAACPQVIAAGSGRPAIIVLDYIQKKYGTVTFNHEMHAGLAEGCSKCHHQHNDRSRAVCRECHEINDQVFRSSAKQGFLPCSGCHTDFSADTPGTPGLMVALHNKCFQCHVGMGGLGSSPKGCTEMCHARK